MNLQEIREQIPSASPGKLSELLVSLSEYYSRLSDELGEIKVFKTDVWLELRGREGIKSDRMADRLWDATDQGKKEIKISYTIKGIEKMQSAIKSMLRTKENEAKNMF